MASVAFHQFNQFRANGKVRLFGEYGGYGPASRRATLSFVDDVVAVNLGSLDNPGKSGIFNLGTGAGPNPSTMWPPRCWARCRARRARQPTSMRGGRSSTSPSLTPPARQVPVLAPRPIWRAAVPGGCDHAFADVQTGGRATWFRWRATPRVCPGSVAGQRRRPVCRYRVCRHGGCWFHYPFEEVPMLKKLLGLVVMLVCRCIVRCGRCQQASAAELDGIISIGPASRPRSLKSARRATSRTGKRLCRARQGRRPRQCRQVLSPKA